MLEKVRYVDYGKGIGAEAFTDGYAYDDYSCLYLLSVAGRDSSVKAITSALVSGRTVEIVSQEPIQAGPAWGQRYRTLSAKLPSGHLHQLLVTDGLFGSGNRDGERLLYVGREDDAAGVVYEAVRNGYPVPLIPAWSEWLYEKLREEEFLEELRGTRKVLRLGLDEELLDELISEGVRNGEISF